MKIDQMLTSSYLKQSDVDGEVVVTVREVKKQNVARKDEDAEYKFVLFFEQYEKGLVLNATNIKRMGKACGEDTDDWVGKSVMLYVDPEIEYGGNIVGGLRIRGTKNPATKARTAVSDADVNKQLRDAEDLPF